MTCEDVPKIVARAKEITAKPKPKVSHACACEEESNAEEEEESTECPDAAG